MIDIESKIISCREDTNDYRLCLTREEIDEIKEALSTCDTCIHKVSKEDIEQIRIDVIAEISREIRLLYGNEYEQQIRVEAIEECIQIVQKIKDDYNNAKFGEQIPINYGTICGIIISLEQLKEHNK